MDGEDTSISNNSALGASGGGVHNTAIYSGDPAQFVMKNGKINENYSAAFAGGVNNDTERTDNVPRDVIFTMNAGEISGNTAGASGGGVSNASVFTMTGGVIESNKAGGDGGGVNNTNSRMDLHGNQMVIRCEFIMTHGFIHDNEAEGTGGGVNNSTVWSDKQAVVFDLTDSTISENRSTGEWGYGGGVRNDVNVDTTMTDSIISENYAEAAGGGVSVQGTFTMVGSSEIADNIANREGAGGVNSAADMFLMKDTSSICGNETLGSDSVGGGVRNYFGGTFVMDAETKVFDNEAVSDGGGLWNDATLTIGGVIEGNIAGGDGGGVWSFPGEDKTYPGLSVIESGVSFSENKARLIAFPTLDDPIRQSEVSLHWLTLSQAVAFTGTDFNNFDINYAAATVVYLPGTTDPVTNLPNNGNPIAEVPGSSVAVSSQIPQRAGYKFVGWKLVSGLDFADITNGTFVMPDNTVFFEAVWQRIGLPQPPATGDALSFSSMLVMLLTSSIALGGAYRFSRDEKHRSDSF
jgi:hypothetical protein